MNTSSLNRFFPAFRALGIGLCIAGMSVIAINSAAAANLSWSSTGNSTLGGTGTWDLSTPNWWNGSSGVAWTDTAGTADIANFGGTAGTVTLGQSLGALGLVFNTTGYTIATGANTLTLGSSGINASSLTSGTTTISGNVALAADQSWNVGLGATLAASAGISGSTFGINKTGYGTLTLTGANTYTGTTTVTGGTLNIGGGTANGSISSSSPLSMGGGTLTFTRTGTNTQTFNDTAFTGGYSTINTTVATNTLALGALSRTSGSGASVNFGSAGTITGTLTTSTANTNGILGGWATTGNAGTTAATADWVANDGSGNIVAYTGYTAVSGVTAPVSTQNWNNTAQAATTQVNASGTVNSLKIGADFSVGSGSTLTVGSGGILLSGISRWVLNNNAGSTAGTGAITSGLASGELFVSVADALYNNTGDANNWRIWTNIVNGSNPTILVKNGPGALTLMYGSTYTGGTIINSGILGSRLSTTGAAGSVTAGPIGTGALTINQGGAYEMHLQGSTGSAGGTLLTLANAVTLNGGALWSLDGYSHVTGTVTVNSTGGFLGSTYSGGSGAYTGTGTTGYSKGLFIDGVLSGSGDLTIQHAGVGGNGSLAEASGANTNITGNNFDQSIVILTNNSNTYSGTVTVNGSGSANNTVYLGVNGNTVLQNATVNVGGTANGVGSANWGASPILFQTSGTASVVGDSFTFGALTGSGNITLTEINEGNLAVGNSVALTVGGNNSSTTYSGILSGGGSLTKAGSGTMTLSGANTHTGGTTVSAGTLKIGNATALGGNAGAASVTSGAVLDLNGITMTGTNALTLNGTGISSGGALTNSSSTAGTYAGLVGLGSASSIVANNGNIILSNTGTITGSGNNLTLSGTATGSSIASIIGTGAGTVTKNGTGTWTLSGASTYTGATTINAGTLAVKGSLAAGSAVAVNAGGTLAGTDVASGSSTVGGAITLAGGTNAATQGTINLANSNVETLNTGALTVGGSSGNFSQINFNLNPTTSDLIAMGANVFTVNDGGVHLTISLTGGTPVSGTYDLLTFGSGAGTGFATGTGTAVGSLTLTNPSLTFGVTGALNVTSTAVQLSVTASAAPATAYWLGNQGTTWASNNGTNGNFTTDKPGTSPVTALPASTTDVIFAATGATNLTNTLGLDFSVKSLTFDATTAAANITGSNILTVGTGGITLENGNGGATLGMTTLALGSSQTWANASSNDLTVAASITAGGGSTLTINNSSTGKTVLSGTNTYSGATAVNGGILKAGSTGGLSPNSAYTLADTAGVLLDITGFNSSVGSLAGGGASGGNVTLGAATLTAGSDNSSTTYAGVIGGTGGLTKAGTGTMILTGTNTYTGATTVNAGTLTASGGTAIEDTSAVVLANTSGATFNLANSETVGSLAGGGATGGNVTLGANTLTTGGNNSTTTYAGAISGTGGAIIKNGSGAMTLSGVNTYDGGTTLNTGTLTAGSTTAFGATASTLTINGGSLDSSVVNLTLANNNAQNWNGDFTFVGTNSLNLGTGAVTLGANRQVTVTANTLTVGGAIGGSGFSLTKAGAGMLALLSANTYSGGSTINGGTLAIGGTVAANSGALGAGAVTVNSGATLRPGYAVSVNSNVATVANDITLAGGSIFADDGFQHLSGALNVTSASTLGSTYNAGNNGAGERNKGLFLDGIVSGSANLTLQQSGFDTGHSYNTSIVHFTNAANTYSGTVTVTPMAGSNTTSGGSFLGLSASTALQFATVNLNGNSAGLRFGNSPIVFNTGLGTATLGALSGSGNVVLTGYDEINHVYGADSIALTVGGNNASTTYSGVMSGAGSLTKAGSGTMTLSGLNSLTGNVTISNGTVAAGTGIAGALATSITSNLGDIGTAVSRNITINNGGILSLTGGNVLGTGGSTGTLAGVTLVVNSGGVFQTGANAAGAGWWNKIGAVNLNGGSIHVGSGANNTNFQGLALIGTVTVGGSSASVIDNLGSSDSAYNAIHLGQNATASQVITFDVADATGDASTDLTVSAKLINTSSNLVASGLQKTGVGTMAISGANAYTGTTTVNGGTLLLGSATTLQSATGNVSVNSGGTLSSSVADSTLGGNLSLAGGTIAALNAASAGTLTLSSNKTFSMTSGTWSLDLVALDSIIGAGVGSTFNVDAGTFALSNVSVGTYSILTGFDTTGNALGLEGNFNFTGLAIDQTASLSISGGSLNLTVAAVPEPSAYALAIGGLLGVMIIIRRRRAYQ